MTTIKTMHEKPCRISVRSQQVMDGQSQEEMQLLTGAITEEHGAFRIEYTETLESEDEVHTSIIITDPWVYPHVSVTRSGAIVSNMKFALGERYDFSYTTTMGAFEFSVATTDVVFERKHGKYYLKLYYDLISMGALLSNNEISYVVYPEV